MVKSDVLKISLTPVELIVVLTLLQNFEKFGRLKNVSGIFGKKLPRDTFDGAFQIRLPLHKILPLVLTKHCYAPG